MDYPHSSVSIAGTSWQSHTSPLPPPPTAAVPLQSLPEALLDKNGQPGLHTCTTCGSTRIEVVRPVEGRELREAGSGTQVIFNVLKKQNIVFGQFLAKCFGNPDALTNGGMQTIMRFLHGESKGPQAVDVVRAIYQHKFSRQNSSTGHLIPARFTTSKPYATPPAKSPSISEADAHATADIPSHNLNLPTSESSEITPPVPPLSATPPVPEAHEKRAYYTLQKFFVEETIELASSEIGSLSKREEVRALDGGNFGWQTIVACSFTSLQWLVMHTAPIMWHILTRAAVGAKRDVSLGPDEPVRDLESALPAQNVDSASRTRTPRDPWLVSELRALKTCINI